MKVEMLSNTIIVYLLDNKKYNEDSDIKKILINVFDNLEENISAFLENSKKMTEKERVEARYQRFRSM